MLLIRDLTLALNISVQFVRTSSLSCTASRSEKLICICDKLQAATYLSPRGSAQYLKIDDFENRTRVSLEFQSYDPSSYPQYRSDHFVTHLSIVDVVANMGFSMARSYVLGLV